jgi:hypothetical protein
MREEFMKELQTMAMEELLMLKAAIEKELQRRAAEDELVIYQHDCCNSSSYHLHKYKHWAKVVRAVDTTKINGFAFIGDFLPMDKQSRVAAGAIVVEVCGDTIKAYRVAKEGKEKIAESKTNRMVEFIEKVAAVLKKQ